MANTYRWDCSWVETHNEYGGQTDVIYQVNWTLWGEDESGNKARQCNVLELDISDLSNFTSFDSVTHSMVQGWVETALGEDEITVLKSLIDATIVNNTTITTQSRTISSTE